MSRKRKTYSADFKAKLVLELLEGEKTLNEIASHYDILPRSLKQWKKQFLENASLAFDKSAVVKEYREEIDQLKKEKDKTSKKLGEVIVERDFVVEKLKSLVSSNQRAKAADTKLTLSLNRQLNLLSVSKTAYYYDPVVPFSSQADKALLDVIDVIHTKHPYYGTRRVARLLRRLGYLVGRKRIKHAFEHMGIRALYPKVKTTRANREHTKYPYLLTEFKDKQGHVVIPRPNQVWSTDITYIKLENGYAYLAAIIDWHTKKILSWKLSNTMDTTLTTAVLNEALTLHDTPQIVNTDQGSQYTAKEHIDILIQNGISISMDAKGRSIDNIAIERFWRTLKYEEVYPASYQTMKEAREGIGAYIQIYNQERLHSALEYRTPDEAYYPGVNSRAYDAKKVLQNVA